jgi:hypothetical protein
MPQISGRRRGGQSKLRQLKFVTLVAYLQVEGLCRRGIASAQHAGNSCPALCLAAVLETVLWFLATRVFSIDVMAFQCRVFSR